MFVYLSERGVREGESERVGGRVRREGEEEREEEEGRVRGEGEG